MSYMPIYVFKDNLGIRMLNKLGGQKPEKQFLRGVLRREPFTAQCCQQTTRSGEQDAISERERERKRITTYIHIQVPPAKKKKKKDKKKKKKKDLKKSRIYQTPLRLICRVRSEHNYRIWWAGGQGYDVCDAYQFSSSVSATCSLKVVLCNFI